MDLSIYTPTCQWHRVSLSGKNSNPTGSHPVYMKGPTWLLIIQVAEQPEQFGELPTTSNTSTSSKNK